MEKVGQNNNPHSLTTQFLCRQHFFVVVGWAGDCEVSPSPSRHTVCSQIDRGRTFYSLVWLSEKLSWWQRNSWRNILNIWAACSHRTRTRRRQWWRLTNISLCWTWPWLGNNKGGFSDWSSTLTSTTFYSKYFSSSLLPALCSVFLS